jgi:hypothetical protein
MPAKAEWLVRLPEIRATLERFDAPVVDRSVIEELFGLKRRRAIVLMHQLGGYQAGRTFLVDRLRLLGRLAALEGEGDYHVENRRRERLQGFLCASREHLLATRIAIPAGDAETRFTLDSLGPGVRLTPGMLCIEFGQPVELLQKLHTLAQAIAREFEKFEDMARDGPAGRAPRRALMATSCGDLDAVG